MVIRSKQCIMALSLALAATGCVDELDRDEGFVEDKDGDNTDPRIVGGTDASQGEYPWQISLRGSGDSHRCGGSILNENWVVTANHCVEGTSASSLSVVAGILRRSESSTAGQIRQVAEVRMYPDYIDASKGKDIALLRLDSPLDLSGPNAKAIRVATANSADLEAPATLAAVTGWGTLSSGGGALPDVLQEVQVPLISNQDAQAAYTRETITPDQIAAGYIGVGGKDSCQGDSGGPLVAYRGDGTPVLIGVVSWGYGCADASYPGMYARVSAFSQWTIDTAGAIGDGQDSGGPPPPPVLNKPGLSGLSNDWLDFPIEIPDRITSLDVVMSGGTGDADLYIAFNRLPGRTDYDCRSFRLTNNEACSIANPQEGRWYASVRGYSSFSGANLTAQTE